MLYSSIIEAMGHSSIIKLSNLFPNHSVWLKSNLPYFSNKLSERLVLHILDTATLAKQLISKTTLIAQLNTPIGLSIAKIGAIKGYKVILYCPISYPRNYINEAKKYGAKIVFHKTNIPTNKIHKRIQQIVTQHSKMWYLSFQNPKLKARLYVDEILQDFPNGISHCIFPIRSSHAPINFISQELKKRFKNLKTFIPISKITSQLNNSQKSSKFSKINRPTTISDINQLITISPLRARQITHIMPTKEGLMVDIKLGALLHATEKLIVHHKVPSTSPILLIQSL